MSQKGLFMTSLGTRDVGAALHCISFVTVSGANNPSATTISGLGVATITGADGGVFTITLDQGYNQVVGAFASVVNVSSVALWYQPELYIADYAADPLVIVVKVGQAVGIADGSASFAAKNSTNLRVCVWLFIKASSGT